MQRVALSDPAHPENGNNYISVGNRSVARINSTGMMTDEVSKRLILDCHTSSKERCGFIFSDGEIYYITNVHAEPHANFFMDQGEILEAVEYLEECNNVSKSKKSILGVFHTHPNNTPWPSPRDIVGWPNPELEFRYWIVTNYEVIEWQLVQKPVQSSFDFEEMGEM